MVGSLEGTGRVVISLGDCEPMQQLCLEAVLYKVYMPGGGENVVYVNGS